MNIQQHAEALDAFAKILETQGGAFAPSPRAGDAVGEIEGAVEGAENLFWVPLTDFYSHRCS